jgi:hypothetical protein
MILMSKEVYEAGLAQKIKNALERFALNQI